MASLDLRKFTNPDFLRSIEQARLCAFLLPWRGYLEDRGIDLRDAQALDIDALAAVLMSPTERHPPDLIDALYYVHETASSEDMDAFLERAESNGLTLKHDLITTPADLAVQVWLTAPDVVRERHAENIAYRQKHFLYYGGVHGEKRTFPLVDDALRSHMEAALDDWFDERRRGRGCRILFFPNGLKVWILVRHGLHMRREASQLEDGRPSVEMYRPQQHDVLIYDAETDEIGVHAGTKGEIKLYLRTLGKFIFGDDDYFPPADKFSLDPLFEDGAACVVCEDVPGLETIRLVEYRRYWGGRYKEIEIRRATDIFGSLADRGQHIQPHGMLVSASFRVKFADSSKERSVIIRPPASARYDRNDDSELIERWLSRRGFTFESERSDDEAPIKVLEGA